MNRKIVQFTSVAILTLAMAGCSVGGIAQSVQSSSQNNAQTATTTAPVAPSTAQTQSTAGSSATNPAAVAAVEGTLQQIYTQVNPSVVNVQVTEAATSSSGSNSPFDFQGGPQSTPSQALGSGFVWDKSGDIVTNNHVVTGASTIDVKFSDGLTVPAAIVGQDVNADLAVIKVSVPAERLQPVTLADSTQVKIGQLAVAIGNPFGLEGSMSAGIVSGLGRSLDVNGSSTDTSTGSYTIPDIIQTDAPINPGNSGGVLVDDQGHVLGVTAAIDSSSGASAGVGFVIPSVIVNKVVPSLIKTGKYDHSWLGLSGMDMRPELATPMKLNSDQRGVLVEDVTAGGPADKAGIKGSSTPITLDGSQVNVGGDVVVGVDGTTVNSFSDLVTYLARNTEVGQKITLSLMRDGKVTSADVTLGARPDTNTQVANSNTNPQQSNPTQSSGWLGISGYTLTSEVNQAMKLTTDQKGVLVVRVQSGSPAEKAGLHGGTQPMLAGGQALLIGGDVITGIDTHAVTSMEDLQTLIAQTQPGQEITLSILRSGKAMDLKVTVGTAPVSQP